MTLASAMACDLGQDEADDSTSAGVDDASAGDAESSVGSADGYDDGPGATSGASSVSATGVDDGPWGPPTATSGASWGDTEGWGSSWGDDGGWTTFATTATTGWSDGGTASASGGTDGWASATGATSGDTEGLACDVPIAPGGNFYACACEDPTCDIEYNNVAPIPDFEQLCGCLCEQSGCGGAVGGVGEAGGEEDGGPPP